MTSPVSWPWCSRLLRLFAVVAVVAVSLVVAPAAPASAAPTPSPSPSASAREKCAPRNTGVPGPGSGLPNAPAAVLNWCLPWASLVGDTWYTECSKAVAVDELDKCEAVTLSLASPPKDRTESVLNARQPGSPGAADNAAVQCELFGERADDDAQRANQWRAKQQRCEQVRSYLEKRSSAQYGKDNCWLDVSCQVSKGVRSGFEGLVDVAVKGVEWALSRLAVAIFEVTSPEPSEAFYGVYNSVAGLMIFLVFLYFVFSVSVSALRPGGPGPVAAMLGLLRAFLGITFAGGIAFTLVAAWDQATVALIDSNVSRGWDPGVMPRALQAAGVEDGTILVTFVIAVFALIGLLFVFIQLLFRSVLAAAAALFGAAAMAKHALVPAGKGDGRTWFWTVNALASSKFWIAALWIYGSRLTSESDDVMNALRGLLMIWIMVLAPAVLLRLTTMFDGYIADVNAGQMLGAGLNMVGAQAIGEKLQGLGGAGGSGGGGDSSGGGGGGSDAVGLMNPEAIATTPVAAAGGGGDSGMNDAAQAAQTSQDGEKVGEPKNVENGQGDPDVGTDGGGGPGPAQGIGKPNAEEAEGVGSDTETAKHDVASGTLTAPGDATGSGGSLPVTPGAGASQATQQMPPSPDPGGSGGAGMPGGSDDGQQPGSGASSQGGAGSEGQSSAAKGAGAGRGGAAAGGAAEVPIVPV